VRETVRVVLAPDFHEQLAKVADPSMREAGQIVLNNMRARIPVSTDGSYGRQAAYARSKLRDLREGRDPRGHYLDVGTDATTPDGTCYPAILEHGSKPHEIRSHGKYPLRDEQGHVFGRVVRHPGTKPIPWARLSAMALNGRRV
jgi:hypothetical protein